MKYWNKLPVTLAELCIDTTLRCGQSFRWRKIDDEWICTLHGRILSLKQDSTSVHYSVAWPEGRLKEAPTSSPLRDSKVLLEDDTEALLRHYFSLDLNLSNLYDQWSSVDPNFRKKAPTFTGVRILNQDAWEALIAFICSSNNNISRISQMVHKLCKHYGQFLGHAKEEAMHDFPTPEALTGKNVEGHLRELGFGYRAKYIAETARIIVNEKPKNWLEALRNPEVPSFTSQHEPLEKHTTYKEAHDELLSLKGVGPKVADCVCLMGLGWAESVPVDTHVWQIAQRDYKFGKKAKTFNKAMYDAVGDHFRTLWGKHAGWAHSVLFTADLREFADRSPTKTESRIVKLEEVSIEENQGSALSSTPTKKRKATVKTEVKTEVEVAKVSDVPIQAVDVSPKRRRTRSRR